MICTKLQKFLYQIVLNIPVSYIGKRTSCNRRFKSDNVYSGVIDSNMCRGTYIYILKEICGIYNVNI